MTGPRLFREGESHRALPLPRALEMAHELAVEHVRACGGVPNKAAWWPQWDKFCQTYPGLRLLDLKIIDAYARAALRYDGGDPEGRGLWARQRWGNVGETVDAAAD